jgi:peptidoglycan/LPS O-acetylase OafA/YrhL
MRRITEWDGLRGLACLLVLLLHLVVRMLSPEGPLGYLRAWLHVSVTGVDLFFVLSGFLLGSILLDNRGSPNLLKVFYARRTFRIFPLYFAFVGAGTLVPLLVGRGGSDGRIPGWMYATYLQNFGMAYYGEMGLSYLDITWSLAIEEQFYLILPLLVILLPLRWLPWVCAAAVISAPLLRWAFPGVPAYVLLPCRWDALFLGVLGAHLRSSSRLGWYILLAFSAVGLVAWTWQPSWFPLEPLSHTLYGLGWLSVLMTCRTLPWLSWCCRFPPLVGLGTISYGVYLFHPAVFGVTTALLPDKNVLSNSLIGLSVSAVALTMTVVLALISYRWFEVPLLRIGHRWKYERPVERAAPELAMASVSRTPSPSIAFQSPP